jgi:hypothetical protein
MSDEQTTVVNDDSGQTSGEPAGGDAAPTNADFKNTPAYQAMARQIAEYQRDKQEREEADAKAKQEAEQKALEAKGEYEKALELQKRQFEDMQKKHASELLKRDLKAALFQAGATNSIFVDGAISAYKDGDISEYVKSLQSDEGNKLFFGQQKTVIPPPGNPNLNSASFTKEQLRQMEQSPDRETRLKAIAYKERLYNEGKTP